MSYKFSLHKTLITMIFILLILFVFFKSNGITLPDKPLPDKPLPDKPSQEIIRVRNSSSVPTFKLYLHPSPDLVSDTFFKYGYWYDCQAFYSLATSKLSKVKKLVVVEVGTNIGTCSFQYVANGHKVYGFEPFKPTIKLLRKSLMDNYNLPGELILIEAAAGKEKGLTHVFYENGNLGNSRTGDNSKDYNIKNFQYKKHNKIRMTTIDSIVSEHVHLLKIDCQGCEYYAVQGAVKLIENYGIDIVIFELTPIFIEANNQNPSNLLHFFEERNFTIYHDKEIIIKENIDNFVNNIKKTRLDTTIVCYNKATKFT